MTDPQIALMMLGLFIVFVFLGFPIAFTLMAMGIMFGYYAYFDADRMWRSFNRLTEDAGWWDQTSLSVHGSYSRKLTGRPASDVCSQTSMLRPIVVHRPESGGTGRTPSSWPSIRLKTRASASPGATTNTRWSSPNKVARW